MAQRSWQAALTRVDRVRSHTSDPVQDELDQRLRDHVASYQSADDRELRTRLDELDREWDVERVLIVNASTLAGLGVLGGFVNRRVLVFPLFVLSFLLQHGLQGWCPPLAVFRRRGVRTRREIDLERYALKIVRGDLAAPGTTTVDDVLDRAARH
jgi:hypothetical protein